MVKMKFFSIKAGGKSHCFFMVLCAVGLFSCAGQTVIRETASVCTDVKPCVYNHSRYDVLRINYDQFYVVFSAPKECGYSIGYRCFDSQETFLLYDHDCFVCNHLTFEDFLEKLRSLRDEANVFVAYGIRALGGENMPPNRHAQMIARTLRKMNCIVFKAIDEDLPLTRYDDELLVDWSYLNEDETSRGFKGENVLEKWRSKGPYSADQKVDAVRRDKSAGR